MTKTKPLSAKLAIACLIFPALVIAQAGGQPDELWASSNSSFTQLSSGLVSEKEQIYPSGLISLPEDTRYLIWTELKEGRLNLLERLAEKNFRLLKSIPISIGKEGYGKEIEGDKRTPMGVYRVTSYISEEDLTDFYGLGAYPINYPNTWDKLQQRTGYGIWLHGLPKGVEQRPLLDSDGCVVVDNGSLTYLDDFISPGKTLVVLANELSWITNNSTDKDASLIDAIESWEKSWESLNAEAYLANYHAEFTDFRRDLAAWTEYKTRVNGQKSFIDVSLSDLSAISYPGEEGLATVRFYQAYKSSNYEWSGWKELIWQKDEGGRWQILFEGNG